ncbi:MAG: hypothetical protein ABWY25_10225 [Paenisporosarcina sp.]
MEPQQTYVIVTRNQKGYLVTSLSCSKVERVICIVWKTLNSWDSDAKSGDDRFKISTEDIDWLVIELLIGIVVSDVLVPDTPIMSYLRIPYTGKPLPEKFKPPPIS